jgi:hypothetical protein
MNTGTQVLGLLRDNPLGLIQSMVTPAVMISACGLLLLALTNKLGRIVDRVRALNTEDRAACPGDETVRRMSIRNQIEELVRRARYIRNACGLLYLAVTVFVLTSLCVGLAYFSRVFELLMIVTFIAGLVVVVWAGILAYLEMRVSHRVMLEEIKELRLHD